MSTLRQRFTFANVVSVIALFVALGGTGYAALNLPKNSVGTKQLKKEAVTAAKIKNGAVTATKVQSGALTGAQIDASTLGTVPAAQTAQTAQIAQVAQIANAIAAPEPWHVVGAPGEPPFQHGCKDVPAEYGGPPVAFYKDREDVVHLEGGFEGCEQVGAPAFQLPPGYRSGFNRAFASLSGEVVNVFSSNAAVPSGLRDTVRCGTTAVCYLEGITFRAES